MLQPKPIRPERRNICNQFDNHELSGSLLEKGWTKDLIQIEAITWIRRGITSKNFYPAGETRKDLNDSKKFLAAYTWQENLLFNGMSIDLDHWRKKEKEKVAAFSSLSIGKSTQEDFFQRKIALVHQRNNGTFPSSLRDSHSEVWRVYSPKNPNIGLRVLTSKLKEQSIAFRKLQATFFHSIKLMLEQNRIKPEEYIDLIYWWCDNKKLNLGFYKTSSYNSTSLFKYSIDI